MNFAQPGPRGLRREGSRILGLTFALALGLAAVAQPAPEALIIAAAGTQAPTTPPAGCSTYDTTNTWNRFIEGFGMVSTGYESNNLWSLTGTAENVTPNGDSTALTTGKPAGACNQALKVVVPTDGTETYTATTNSLLIDLDTVQADLTLCLYVETGPDAGEGYSIVSYRGSATPSSSTGIRLQNTGGQIEIFARGAVNSSVINISAGQWYTVRLSFDTAQAAGGSSMTVWANGSAVGSVTFQRQAGTDLNFLFVGAPYDLTANESGTVWFDLIGIKIP